jgi:hypothetical protein
MRPTSDTVTLVCPTWLSAACRVLLSNLPFAAAIIAGNHLPPLVKTLVVGAILFFAPGLAWVNHRTSDRFALLFEAIVVSLGITIVCWLVLAALPGPTNRIAFLLSLCAFTNLGLLLGFRSGRFARCRRPSTIWPQLLLVAGLAFLQSYIGAAYRIPPIDDQDMETQGTAYGLIHFLSPSMVTDRGQSYFFAHPLLLHIWIGASAFVSDDLDRLRYYYDSARKARGGTRAEKDAEFAKELARFEQDPVLLPSRTPNLFLGVFVLFPLAYLIYGLSGSKTAALGACIMYATLPEVYVRSAYGGYMAIANFLSLSCAYFYLQANGQLPMVYASGDIAPKPRPRRLAAIAAFLCGWADQKNILIAVATGLHALFDWVGANTADMWHNLPRRPAVIAAAIVIGGFLLGWSTFIIYGLVIAPHAFILDHLLTHVIWRLDMHSIGVTTLWRNGVKYSSILGLWKQFADHTGWVITVAMLWSVGWSMRRVRRAEGVFLWWALVGAVGFSLVDWRITKHLAQLLPALAVLTGLWWASHQRRTQAITGAFFLLAIAWNIWRIAQMMMHFTPSDNPGVSTDLMWYW